MTDDMSPILICGASFAGLTLARTLARGSVPFVIFEGKGEGSWQKHGFRFDSWCYDRLLEGILPGNEESLRDGLAVDRAVGGKGSAGRAHYEPPSASFRQEESDGRAFRANRGKVSEALAEGLSIRFQHRLESYEATKDGVEVHFDNGESAKGSILVAADGVHSQIRKQALPDHAFTILDYAVYYGQQHLDATTFRGRYGELLHQCTKAEASIDGAAIAVSINSMTADVAKLGWTYSRSASSQSDPLLQPGRAKDKAHDIPPQLYEELDSLGRMLPEPLKGLCDRTRIKNEGDRIVHWLQRTLELPASDLKRVVATQRVAFIGDAAHPLPLLTGDGANHAMLDGLELGEALTNDGVATVQTFYDGAQSRWREAVQEAKDRLELMHTKPALHAKG